MFERSKASPEQEIDETGPVPKSFEEVAVATKKEAEKVKPGKASPEVEAERIASRQRAHDAKVAKYLAGGEF